MKRYNLILSPRAFRQLAGIEDWVEQEAGAEVARRYREAILAYCRQLESFPDRGRPRGDLGLGVNTIVYRRRVTIAYQVEPHMVVIVAIIGRGREIVFALDDWRGSLNSPAAMALPMPEAVPVTLAILPASLMPGSRAAFCSRGGAEARRGRGSGALCCGVGFRSQVQAPARGREEGNCARARCGASASPRLRANNSGACARRPVKAASPPL